MSRSTSSRGAPVYQEALVTRFGQCGAIAGMVFMCAATGNAQTAPPAQPAAPLNQELANAPSIPLPVRTVNNSVHVSATLVTHGAVRRLFGKEIANTYAVVQLTISNSNPDAAFVLHSAYIDVSKWALGGAGLTTVPQKLEPYQASSVSNQISSVEARIARGQLLDAQMWTARNWTVRLLTVAGTVASAGLFNVGETAAKSIAAFNGAVVPGVAFAWPDGTVGQLNRISDFGFQTNKVIPKESGDIVVCFFPMDMFLSRGLRKIFIDSPGLFLSPYQILFTDENADARAALGLPRDVHDRKVELARKGLICFPGPSKDGVDKATEKRLQQAYDACPAPSADVKDDWDEMLRLLAYIGRFGANNIPVIVDGVMTVNVDDVPAAIDDITFEGDPKTAAFWAGGEHQGRIECRFCANGQVSIQESSTLGVADVKVKPDGSDEHHLTFSFKLTKPIDTGTTLHFVVTKPPTDPKKSEGAKSIRAYPVEYVLVTPRVASVTVENNKRVTLKGSSFSNLASHVAKLALSREGGLADDTPIAWPADATASAISFDVPDGLAPGCWDATLTWNAAVVAVPHAQKSEKVLVAAKPKLTGGARLGAAIVVTGTDIVDTSACGGSALSLQLTGPNGQVVKDAKVTFDKFTQVSIDMPPAAKTGSWFIRLGDDDATKIAVK
jgi:hypothetical protein